MKEGSANPVIQRAQRLRHLAEETVRLAKFLQELLHRNGFALDLARVRELEETVTHLIRQVDEVNSQAYLDSVMVCPVDREPVPPERVGLGTCSERCGRILAQRLAERRR